MFFLIKCVFWLAIVFIALPWRNEASSNAAAAGDARAAGAQDGNPAGRPQPTGKRKAAPAREDGALPGLALEAAAKLAAAARDRCLADPKNCRSAIGALETMTTLEAQTSAARKEAPRAAKRKTGAAPVAPD